MKLLMVVKLKAGLPLTAVCPIIVPLFSVGDPVYVNVPDKVSALAGDGGAVEQHPTTGPLVNNPEKLYVVALAAPTVSAST
jgi:hypothetical protein